MSVLVPVPEPPALSRSPEEGQHGGREPGHILAQLSAALENPDIKALEWSKDGRGALIHAELYEEEMGKNKELFPELADLGCVAVLQAWLLAHGFKLKGPKVNSQGLLFQHPNFQRSHRTAKELGSLGGDAGLSAKQQKKRKKKRRVRSLRPPPRATSQDTLRQLPRLRPLYQYINFETPELMHPSADDQVPGLAQPSQVPAAPRKAAAPQQEDTRASSAPEIPDPEGGDKSMQLDIDRMLRYAAQLVPLLFPQYQ
ncbi:uncharacterized protein C16orf86 homolog [Tyto alba]|uniref:uncharacterized protein C16orf86 homolog n=1 Tax=Tyto alba TaxID=56313 RepID=UPI001C6717C3|nr:uncharacterized protein C16orf86 homolog [Tyto alba]